MKGYFSNDRNRAELKIAISRGVVSIVDLETMTSYAKDRGAKEGKVLSSQEHKAKESFHTYADAGKQKTTLIQYRGKGMFSESRHCMNLNPDYESQEFILFHSSEGSFKKIFCSSQEMVDVIKAIANDEDPYPEFSGKTSGKKAKTEKKDVYDLDDPEVEIRGLNSLFDTFETYGHVGTEVKKGDVCPKTWLVEGFKGDDSEKVEKKFNQFLIVKSVERKGRIVTLEAKTTPEEISRFKTGKLILKAIKTEEQKQSVLDTTLADLRGEKGKEIDTNISDLKVKLEKLEKDKRDLEEKIKTESRYKTAEKELETAKTNTQTLKTNFANIAK